jgi:uroporphyrin-3 C-methyltransferase
MGEGHDSTTAGEPLPAGQVAPEQEAAPRKAAGQGTATDWLFQGGSGKPQSSGAAVASKGSIAGKIIISLLVLAVAGLGFYTREQHKAIEVLFGQYNSLNQQRDEIASRSAGQIAAMEESWQALEAAVQNELQQARTTLAGQNALIDTLGRDLVATRLRITDSGAGASQVWMLSEAESLLRLARQRLLLARDVRSATGLLVSVDDLLSQLNDPAVFAVREALANDLAALQGVREVDLPGLYTQLGELVERVLGLEIKADGKGQAFVMPDPVEPAEAAGWLDRLKNRVDRYFVITRSDAGPIPVLTPEQAWVIKQAQALRLEQARLALLKGQQETWQVVLDAAITGIEANLDGEGKEDLLVTLATLRDTPILTNIPPASNGLNAIRQILPQAVIESGSTEP